MSKKFFSAIVTLSLGLVAFHNSNAQAVQTHAAITSIDELRAAAAGEAAKVLPPISSDRQRYEAGPFDPRLRLAKCDRALTSKLGPAAIRTDRTLIELRCDGAQSWQIYVPVRIIGTSSVLRTRRALVAGEVLQATDVETVERDAEQLPAGVLTPELSIRDMTTAHAIAAGSVLTSRDLIAARTVEKGQTVLLVGTSAALAIKMSGMAMENGFLNQRVKVKNLSSGRIVEGFARAPGIVEVVLPKLE